MRAMLTPLVDDGPGFHSDMPVGELTERDTRAIKASVISSAPLVVETEDGVTHEHSRPLSDPKGLGGSSRSIRDQEIEVRRLAREGSKATSCKTRARGENVDEPQRPLPNPH